MKTYIGMKVVQAKPAVTVNGCIWPEGMALPEEYRRPRLELDQEQNCCGTVVEEGYVYISENHYPVFEPKEEFEKRFFDAENVTFSIALDAMKRGGRIARKGWNGKGMYVFLADEVEFRTEADISEFENSEDGVYTSEMLVLRTAQGTFQPGWLATQSDILADDWYVLG